MKRTLAWACLVAIAVAGLQAPQASQMTEELAVSVVVRDRAGRILTGLRPTDFIARADGERLDVSFASVPARRFLVLLDFSTSMFGGQAVQGRWHSDNPRSVTGSALGAVTGEWARRGVLTLAGFLRPADSLRIGSFGAKQLLTPPVVSSDQINRAWSSIVQSDGPSPIWDAVVSSVSLLSGGRERSIIILVTDGRAAGSRMGFDEAAELAASSAVTLYTTGPYAGLERIRDDSALDPRTALATLAARTGGRLISPGVGSDLRDVVRQIVEDLGSHYSLSFPANRITDTSTLRLTVPGATATIVLRRHER